jgi:hypothetical protein
MDEVFELFDHGLLSAGPPLFNHTTGQGVWHEERQSWNSAVKFGSPGVPLGRPNSRRCLA